MRGLFFKLLTLAIAMVFSSAAMAATDMWTCKTNASSASPGSNEEKADTEMAKVGKEASSAFSFAYANCRNCTKITCSKE